VKVCIDDFATKKRHTYGTVMANIDTGRIVDMLESRESAEVSAWLATFPNLELVAATVHKCTQTRLEPPTRA
jgi:transposase